MLARHKHESRVQRKLCYRVDILNVSFSATGTLSPRDLEELGRRSVVQVKRQVVNLKNGVRHVRATWNFNGKPTRQDPVTCWTISKLSYQCTTDATIHTNKPVIPIPRSAVWLARKMMPQPRSSLSADFSTGIGVLVEYSIGEQLLCTLSFSCLGATC